jgi:predicted permease
MPDWRGYVRERLCLTSASPEEEADAIQEIASQLQDAYIDALKLGLSPGEAERDAKSHITDWEHLAKELSDIRRYARATKSTFTEEEGRRMNLRESIESIVVDVRYGVRRLLRMPAFTFVAVLTLAIGIGANTVIFSAMNRLFLNPINSVDADKIVAIRSNYEKLNLRAISTSTTVFAEVRDSKEVFSVAALASVDDVNYYNGSHTEHLFVHRVSWQWFDVFAAKPIIGRSFAQEEDLPNNNRVVVLEYGTWMGLFGGDASIVGKKIQLNQQPYEVIGVMGPDFPRMLGPDIQFSEVSLWTPLGLPADAYGPRARFNESYLVFARLRTGVSTRQAEAFMQVLTQRVYDNQRIGAYAKNNGWSVSAIPFIKFVSGDLQIPLFILAAAVGFVLLIACSNIAGLKLAQASGQARELAVRAAIGAGRWRLVRQTLLESTVLGMAGALTGFVLAYAGLQVLPSFAPAPLSAGLHIHVNTSVMIFTAVIGLAAGILFGIAPAWQTARADTHDALKEGGRAGTAGPAQARLRSLLVAIEVSLALILLVGSGLFLKSLIRLQAVETGFDAHGVMTGFVSLPQEQYADVARRNAFFKSVVDRLQHTPGVINAAAALPIPFFGGTGGSFNIEGVTVAPGDPVPHGAVQWVTPDYFSTLGIPIKRGRVFTEQDNIGNQPVAIIDENLARQYWPNENPIGKRIRRTVASAPWITIIGIVGHVKSSELAVDSGKGVYFIPIAQDSPPAAALVVKTSMPPGQVSAEMREALRLTDPTQSVFALETMEERIMETLGARRFAVTLLTGFAGIAVFLAGLGIYGVISYVTSQRTHEIGIRVALGARPGEILGLVISHGMKIAGAGILGGCVAGVAFARLVSNQLFQTSYFDPVTLVVTASVLLIVTLVASFIPARRATRIDPIAACRYE